MRCMSTPITKVAEMAKKLTKGKRLYLLQIVREWHLNPTREERRERAVVEAKRLADWMKFEHSQSRVYMAIYC